MLNIVKADKRVVMVLGEQQFALTMVARWLKTCGISTDNTITYADPKDAFSAMTTALDATSTWCVYDAKITTRLSCWQSLVCKTHADDSYVIVLQNPLTSASHNHQHGKLDLEAGLLAWLNTMMIAIDGTHSKKRVVVPFDLLCTDGVRQLTRMCRELGIKIPDTQALCLHAEEFRVKSGHRLEYQARDLVAHPAVMAVPLCQRVYLLLSKLADGRMTFSDHEFYTEWQILKNEYDKYYPLYHYANLLLSENNLLENDIRKIHQSWSWKLLSPLRFIPNLVKAIYKNSQDEELQQSHG